MNKETCHNDETGHVSVYAQKKGAKGDVPFAPR